MVFPLVTSGPPPHLDMPESLVTEYNEARVVFSFSPRAAAALLRLALQKLMKELGEEGKHIDADIKSLVSKGLSVDMQQALDYCRVVGNESVHPGQIDLNDSPEMGLVMFNIINSIIEDRITRPKKMQELYAMIPQGKRDAITRRDNKMKETS